jgi:hypothetical protein
MHPTTARPRLPPRRIIPVQPALPPQVVAVLITTRRPVLLDQLLDPRRQAGTHKSTRRGGDPVHTIPLVGEKKFILSHDAPPHALLATLNATSHPLKGAQNYFSFVF